MAYELTVGLLVHNRDLYAQYRDAIKPHLAVADARFRYDFEIASTLRSEAPHEINRVFVLEFGDRAKKEQFFANPEYRAIRSRLYENAVSGTTIITERET